MWTLRCGCLSSSIQHSNCVSRSVTTVKTMKLSSRALNNWDLKLLKEKAQTIAQIEYTTHQYLFPLCFELYAARCDPEVRVASSASFCAQDAHKRFLPLCIWAIPFRIILLCNERLLIVFLVLSYLSYVAAFITVLYIKKKYFNFIYILYINIFRLLIFHECILQQYKEQCVTFYQI